MDGSDAARGALDHEYDPVIAALQERGFTDVSRVPFDANLTGRSLASFITGTASLGETIEGNTFRPGALVDNLTSFGAVPQNFEPTGESQVSIARWVAMGVAGVHGTTDEPLNNVFPARWFVVDYVDGATLAEAYLARMPYTYWHNLVLGDPMLAPYAIRPEVVVEGVVDGESVGAPRRITVHASDPEGMGIATVVLYVDGVEVARADGADLETCLSVPAGTRVQLLAVAQKLDDDSDRGRHRPKGWTSLRIDSPGTTGDCPADMPDAGPRPDAASLPDAGPMSPDAGPTPPPAGGCSCSTPQTPNNPLWFLLLALLLTKPFRKRVE
jgi:MYXO-CTERM domain-containing protein